MSKLTLILLGILVAISLLMTIQTIRLNNTKDNLARVTAEYDGYIIKVAGELAQLKIDVESAKNESEHQSSITAERLKRCQALLAEKPKEIIINETTEFSSDNKSDPINSIIHGLF